MRQFVDYIHASFLDATGCNRDNSYSELNATADELINFEIPVGLGFTLSSLATSKFATSYQLGTFGAVDGSLAYLYTSAPLEGVVPQSDKLPLSALLRSYRQLNDLLARAQKAANKPAGPTGPPGQNAVLRSLISGSYMVYGRLYLPQSILEASVIKRLSTSLQVQLSAVSAESLRNGGTILALAQYDRDKYGVEAVASTDGGLLGLRGLYNFGGDAAGPPSPDGGGGNGERIYGRFSAGAEMYYGTLNKSGGMSVGARFATLPSHRGTPLTATLTLNPLMGNISASYAVQAQRYCSLATSMNFNVYSYESGWRVGLELWSKRRPGGFLLGVDPDTIVRAQRRDGAEKTGKKAERSFQAKMEWRLDDPEPSERPPPPPPPPRPAERGGEDEYLGVLKARIDQSLKIGLLWEGRVKSLIFSLGTGLDLHRLDQAFRTVGLQIQFSS